MGKSPVGNGAFSDDDSERKIISKNKKQTSPIVLSEEEIEKKPTNALRKTQRDSMDNIMSPLISTKDPSKLTDSGGNSIKISVESPSPSPVFKDHKEQPKFKPLTDPNQKNSNNHGFRCSNS